MAIATLIDPKVPVTATPRRSSRKMSPEESHDWQAVDRSIRELASSVQRLSQAVREIQDALSTT